MINLSLIYDSVSLILGSISESVKTLPNTTNLIGALKSSNIFFILAEGNYKPDTKNVEILLKVSIASEERINDLNEKSVNTLTMLVINALHDSNVKGCKSCKFRKFELFTPESGKWIIEVQFLLNTSINANTLEALDPLLKTVNQTITVN